jgi:hypothetical protein
MTPRILNLGTRRRRVVSFMSPSLSISFHCPLDGWAGGPKVGLDAVEKRQISNFKVVITIICFICKST